MLWMAIQKGARKGLETTWMLAKIMVPVFFFVTLLKHSGFLQALAGLFSPLMGFFNLPGEAALSLVLGNGLNLYAGIGSMKALNLSIPQINVLAVMLSFSHSLFMETAVVKKLGVSGLQVMAYRLALMVLSGLLVAFLTRGGIGHAL